MNKDDSYGLFFSNPDPVTRLEMEGKPFISQEENSKPNSLKLLLSDVERGNERQVYQVMAMLSDFGGFNDGVLFFPAILMTLYNSKMFYSVVAAMLPVKHYNRD